MVDLSESEQKARDKNIENIEKIIAVVCPDKYASNAGEIKKMKASGKFWEAVDKVKVKEPVAGEYYTLSYNSSAESLEPVYFWILDFMGGPSKVTKLVDNFSSSPGSGHFSELMGKATRMQEEAMKVMQTIGVLIKSVINIVYDLRQFETRLLDYDAANGKRGKESIEPGNLALKQIWLDNVDIKRGNTSVKAMAFSQASFATLIDAFLIAKDLEEVSKMDLNDRVKRILEQRLLEFKNWRDLSEKELRKRYNMQRAWLKSQVDSLKLYSRWAKPYLKAAEELRMSASLGGNAALVKAFNTIVMQLVLFKQDGVKVEEEMFNKNLPPGFDKLKERGQIRDFFSCNIVSFTFRGIPQRVEQHYAFGGRSEVTFRAYALRKDEIDEMKKRLDESDVKEALQLVEGATQDSLKEIEDDLNYFLKSEEEREKEAQKEKKEKSKSEDINPFTALLGIGEWKLGGKKDDKGKVKPDNYAETVVRNLADFNAKGNCFKIYDIYKKSHGMASVPFDSQIKNDQVKVSFTDLF